MNSLSDMLWFAWPWAGLGGGVVLLIMLLFTDVLRSHPNRLRWKAPYGFHGRWHLAPLSSRGEYAGY